MFLQTLSEKTFHKKLQIYISKKLKSRNIMHTCVLWNYACRLFLWFAEWYFPRENEIFKKPKYGMFLAIDNYCITRWS